MDGFKRRKPREAEDPMKYYTADRENHITIHAAAEADLDTGDSIFSSWDAVRGTDRPRPKAAGSNLEPPGRGQAVRKFSTRRRAGGAVGERDSEPELGQPALVETPSWSYAAGSGDTLQRPEGPTYQTLGC
jgi:hypothetical protein